MPRLYYVSASGRTKFTKVHWLIIQLCLVQKKHFVYVLSMITNEVIKKKNVIHASNTNRDNQKSHNSTKTLVTIRLAMHCNLVCMVEIQSISSESQCQSSPVIRWTFIRQGGIYLCLSFAFTRTLRVNAWMKSVGMT